MRRTDALIVGGGPAGAAAAIRLARGGVSAIVLEKRTDMRGTVCGGFLGWDAIAGLEALGLNPFTLGARPIERVRLIAGRRQVETRLPGRAAGLSRAALDEALLALASEAGADVRRGVAARQIDESRVSLGDDTILSAGAIVLATGKHKVRGAPARPATGSVGLRTTIDPPAGLDGAIMLHLFAGGYAGLLRLEDGSANLCLSITEARLRAIGGPAGLADGLAREAPALAELLRAAGRWDAIAGVPYGWRARAEGDLYRVGDQAAVIASLAGDGVAIALRSGQAAAEAILAGRAAPAFQTAFAAVTARPLRVGEMVRAVAERPAAAGLAMPLFHRAPGLLRLAARLTRVGH